VVTGIYIPMQLKNLTAQLQIHARRLLSRLMYYHLANAAHYHYCIEKINIILAGKHPNNLFGHIFIILHKIFIGSFKTLYPASGGLQTACISSGGI